MARLRLIDGVAVLLMAVTLALLAQIWSAASGNPLVPFLGRPHQTATSSGGP